MTNKELKPQWRTILEEKLTPAFPVPWRDKEGDEYFSKVIKDSLNEINTLKNGKKDGKCYLGKPDLWINSKEDIQECKDKAQMPQNVSNMEDVVKEMAEYFQGMFNWRHPKSMINVAPPSTIPSLIGTMFGSLFNPNLVEQEGSRNAICAEIEAVSMVCKLIGYDSKISDGHFTFGGTVNYLYGVKMALTKALGEETRWTGVRQDVKVFASRAAHFAKETCSDWTGLGMNNVKVVNTNEDNSMDLNNLEMMMEECYKNGEIIGMIVATVGTTDAFGVDDVKGIREICDRLCTKYNIEKRPFIYADAVIGWAWTVFNGYDFEKNELGFSTEALEGLKECNEKIKDLNLADAVGIDFHKTGFTAYNCSMLCVRDKKDLEMLKRKKDQSAYLYHFSAYSPGEYTLECSRGAAGAFSAWANLKFFGIDGYRSMLGHLVEVSKSFRKALNLEDTIVCVNEKSHGAVSLFRVYPNSEIACAKKQYAKEYECENNKNDLVKYNEYQWEVAQELQTLMLEEDGPALSFTRKYCLTKYGEPVAAIKAYPMSPYMTCDMDDIKEQVIKYILIAQKRVDEKLNITEKIC